MIENNGTLEILWLGYLVKTDILTSIAILIISYCALAIIFTILAKIFHFNFASVKKFFSPNKLKALTKSLQKDEQSFRLILQILQNLENGDDKEALKIHKQLIKTSKNQDLNDFLLAKIHFNLGDYKKSQEIAGKIEDNATSMLILASELELAVKKKDNTQISSLIEDIILKSPQDSQNKTLKKAICIKVNDLASLDNYEEARDLLDGRKILSKDPEISKLFAFVNNSIALKAAGKKSFITAIRQANKALDFDKNYIPAYEVKIRSWLALGFTLKSRNEIKKLYKQTKNPVFITLFDESLKGQSKEKRLSTIKKFIGTNSLKSNKRMNFLNKSSKKVSASEGGNVNYQDLDKINHYSCSKCNSNFERWQPKCPSCNAINSIKI